MSTVKLEVVTPEMATKYLDKNPYNRPIKEERARHFAELMRRGQWPGVNGIEPIIKVSLLFDKHGNLIDGQNTSRAIVLYGKPVKIFMQTNLLTDCIGLIDGISRQRSVQDVMHIRTKLGAFEKGKDPSEVHVKYQNARAQAARFLAKLNKATGEFDRPRTATHAVDEIAKIGLRDHRLNAWLEVTISLNKLGPHGLFAVMFSVADSIDSKLTHKLFDKLCHGTGFDGKDDPTLLFRESLMREGTSRGQRYKNRAGHYRYWFVEAFTKIWNLLRNGSKITRMPQMSDSGTDIQPMR